MWRWLSLSALLIVASASTAGGDPQSVQPAALLLWNTCQNQGENYSQHFVAPGIYRQVLVGSGLSTPFIGLQVEFDIVPMPLTCYIPAPVPDAWRFDEAGCQRGRLQISPATQTSGCPGLTVSNRVDLAWVNPGPTLMGVDGLRVVAASSFESFRPNPVNTYALLEVSYDHRHSVSGPSIPPDSCGGADAPLCYVVSRVALFTASGSVLGLPVNNPCITWQHEPDCWCGFCDPALSTTWGKLKALYR